MTTIVESRGMSLTSRRWKLDIKETVNNYNFKLHHVHGDSGKCDFCGNNLIYVAVIEGDSLVEANTMDKCTKKVYNVGLDCLQLTLGTEWAYYTQVDREIKRLKKIAATKSRAKKYAVKYKDLIDWFNSLHPEQLKSNSFYVSMYRILTTGERVFTDNMEKAIRNKMGKVRMSVNEYDEKLKHHKDVVIPRIKTLRDLVMEVDGIELHTVDIPKFSAFEFVNSVLAFATKVRKITPGQIEGLNKVHIRYTKMKKQKEVLNEKKELDTSSIPY